MSPMDSLKYYKHFLQTGFMAINPLNGHIKAWVGGNNYKYFKYDHVKQGRRQPGSTFKPFVYGAAIEQGYSPCYEVMDFPVTFPIPMVPAGHRKTAMAILPGPNIPCARIGSFHKFRHGFFGEKAYAGSSGRLCATIGNLFAFRTVSGIGFRLQRCERL